jgi:putative membrane protein insertion efficiency factor
MQPVRRTAHYLIRGYQLTLSSLMGRQCRFLPTCSEYTDEAIQKHGLWVGGWMGLSRICRCGPGGDSGYDPPPDDLPDDGHPLTPWRYGRWRGKISCESVDDTKP